MARLNWADRGSRGLVRLYAGIMLATTAAAVAVATLVLGASTTYVSTSEILVQPVITPSGNYIAPSMPTEQRVVLSGSVAGAAAGRLGITRTQALKKADVSVPVDTNLLDISYTAGSANAALRGATVFTEEYLAYRNPEGAKTKVAILVTPANLPTKPERPDYVLVLGVAVIAGLMVGFGAAWLWDRVRGRLRTLDDVRSRTGLEVIASIPRLSRPGKDGDPRLPVPERPQFDRLVARVEGLAESRDEFCLLVTGASPGCGTSTIALQTALALVRLGRRVVLVSSDTSVLPTLSRPTSDPLTVTSDSWTGIGLRETRIPHLRLAAPTGADLPMVEGPGLDRLELQLRTLALDSVVVVDGPTAERCSALALATDRLLLVVDGRRGSRAAATAAVEALDHARQKIAGVVVTQPRRKARSSLPVPVDSSSWTEQAPPHYAQPPARAPKPITGPRPASDRAPYRGSKPPVRPSGTNGTNGTTHGTTNGRAAGAGPRPTDAPPERTEPTTDAGADTPTSRTQGPRGGGKPALGSVAARARAARSDNGL